MPLYQGIVKCRGVVHALERKLNAAEVKIKAREEKPLITPTTMAIIVVAEVVLVGAAVAIGYAVGNRD